MGHETLRAEATPAEDFAEDYKKIWQRKQAPRRTTLSEVECCVLGQYELFKTNKSNLEILPITRWSDAQKSALRHCYESKAQNIARIKSDFLSNLSNAGKMRCPYCMIRQPEDIDHFLPIQHFPEFSTLTINWVYTCHSCNKKKGAGFVRETRSILNPYFDNIPSDKPLLYAAVDIVANGPKVSFLVPDPSPRPDPTRPDPALIAIAQRHFKVLELEKQFELEAGSVLNSTIGTIVQEANGPLTDHTLTERLHARRANLENLGINGWEQCLLEAMEACPGLLDYINSRIKTRPPKAQLPPPRNHRLLNMARGISALGP